MWVNVSHEYMDIDRGQLYDDTKNGIADFEAFCVSIVQFSNKLK